MAASPPPLGPYAKSLTVKPEEFREQRAFLISQGITTIDLVTLYRLLTGDLRFESDRLVVLTFDDGGLNSYTVAYPVLLEYGLVGTFFVITDEIGRPEYMTWDQLREMRRGGMSIESHTTYHSDLTAISDQRLLVELEGSRQTITEEIGVEPIALCYPAGAYNDRVIQAARKAGYLLAVTTQYGKKVNVRDAMKLPRVRISPGMGMEAFAQAVK